MAESVRGYRPGTEGGAVRMYDIRHLTLSPEATRAQAELYEQVAENADNVPCVRNPGPFVSDDLPTDRQAQMMCASCPLAVFKACKTFADLSRPAHGVHAGKVHGRALAEAMKEDHDE